MDPEILSSFLERFESAQQDLVTQSSDPTLRGIADWVASGAIDLDPTFQRRQRWVDGRQSALIESFLLNIPVPPIYLAEDELGRYQVIDGKQRITAIAKFLRNELRLRDLASLHELNGLTFQQLPLRLQTTLELRGLRAVVILRQSDPDLKYEVFTRLNTGGEKLNDQEIRNVAFMGPLNDLIYRLAERSEFLRDRLKIKNSESSAYKTMQDAEFVLRFMTLSRVWAKFSGSLRDSMNDFMRVHRSAHQEQIAVLEREFERALATCEQVWGETAFRRPEGAGWRDQTLAGMYDAQMLAIHELTPAQRQAIVKDPSAAIEATRALFADPEFEDAVRVATNTPSKVAYRTNQMISALTSLA